MFFIESLPIIYMLKDFFYLIIDVWLQKIYVLMPMLFSLRCSSLGAVTGRDLTGHGTYAEYVRLELGGRSLSYFGFHMYKGLPEDLIHVFCLSFKNSLRVYHYGMQHISIARICV